MEDFILPIVVICIGFVVATITHSIIQPKRKIESVAKTTPDAPIEMTVIDKLKKKTPQPNVTVSLSIWQGIKFGFGFGLGILALGIILGIVSGITITSLIATLI